MRVKDDTQSQLAPFKHTGDEKDETFSQVP